METIIVQCPNEDCEADLAVSVTLYGRDIPASWSGPAEHAEWDADVPDACPHCLTTFSREEQAALRTSAIERAQEEEAALRDEADDRRFDEWRERHGVS